MICIDEFGPLEIRPTGGRTWAPKKKPQRQPANYTREHGVRQMLAAYDMQSDRIYAHIRKRKRHQELLAFFKTIRARYSMDIRLYFVLDNFSPHLYHKVKKWARKNRVSLVFTPTNASWLNRIECHFAALRKFVLHNSNYQSHQELADAIHAYIRWRNANPTNSKILKVQNRYNYA